MQTTPLSPEDPAELGGFELLGRIGQGGMGQVYLGESQGGEPAAVKVIKASVVDSEARLRFAQEIEVLKTIWGPRIAAFLDADPEAERPWLATEYVDGPDLRKHITTHGPLPSVLVASLGATLAEALAGVHKQGLVHRDLKPANVLLGPNGPKVIDFGLAVFMESNVTLTAPNTVMGTPACMAPEQAGGVKPLTAPVDVYALGSVLLYAATGHYPYQADNIQVLFHMITDQSREPDLTDAPDVLVPLLTVMLSYAPGDRPGLPDVVKQCRAVIEAQGLKVAQARRRLTSFTASSGPSAPPSASDTAILAEQTTHPLPRVSTVPAPTLPLPQPVDAYTPTVKAEPAPAYADAYAGSGTGDAPPPREETHRKGTPREQTPRDRPKRPAAPAPLIHSVQARKVAQQLRETYAQRAAF
ncbi:serine/threonine-protein kinase [Streptomyces sp. NPDC052236]|uniref:serine/threonine-protein kinase n=1 Tax=Streptomyces sp. NPDC052236 TaxID=3365686 RepID=UPI0037CD64C4